MRLAGHTTLPAQPTQTTRGPLRGPHIPDAALPCRRRPDVFQHPLLEDPASAGGVPDASPTQRHRYLVLLRTARDLCASCPLWAECLQDAVAHVEPYGYVAATTQDDRRWIRRTLGIGNAVGDLPTRITDGSDDTSRRLTRLRSGASDTADRHPGGPSLEQILDAFDLLQDEQLASRTRALRHLQTEAAEGLHEHMHAQPAYGQPRVPGQTRRGKQDMAGAESGQRISFSYEDPAQAVRQTLLGPLIRNARPALASLEQLVTMLMSLPGTKARPEMLQEVRAVREAVEALLPEDAEDPAAPDAAALPLPRPLTGSVSLDLATTDPVAALLRDFVDPLLGELATGLANIEKVATMLAAAESGADEAPLATIRTALQHIHARLPHPTPPDTGTGTAVDGTGTAAVPGPHRRPPTAPSIRAAVEEAVEAFPGPFSARDVLRSLPSGVYGDPAKTISNVLSSLVKSGRLQRLSRGTYARAHDTDDTDDNGHADQGEPKSA
ncbi:WhiB family transcriptional regulator [Streptomyces sp. NPDC047085]|uniref:WhiB family transcriptional regulator n=1 Tax=Streptomyces sp. NPDC047085 TaxID=3155140 RepID=UPI00340C74B4